MSDKTIELLVNIGIALLIVMAGYVVIVVLNHIVHKALERSKLDEVLYPFISNSIKISLWIIVAITAVNYIGVPISAFLTALGAAGVAIALALKDSLSNFAGGILIILNKPFNRGDYIEDYQTAGKVETIDLLYTTLVTYDNKIITIPNGKLANSTIVNFSRAQTRRVDCVFPILYGEDINKVKDILLAVTESNPSVFSDPEPIIGVSGYSENKLDMDLKVWCFTADYSDVKYYLQEQVRIAFEEAGIKMPYPQLDVRIKKK